jgi:chromodomain-helicase-DNA-binding protein 4
MPRPSDTSKETPNIDAPPDGAALKDAHPDLLHELFFRCQTCKRMAHYEHLRPPTPEEEGNAILLAQLYQDNWTCSDCDALIYDVDKILAWRPYPPNAIQPTPDDAAAKYKVPLPREYLIKWKDRSYRRTSWVSHMWLLSKSQAKLRHFLLNGSSVALLPRPVEAGEHSADVTGQRKPGLFEGEPLELSPDAENEETKAHHAFSREALPNAMMHIPPEWKTVDRVLDVLFWRHKPLQKGSKRKQTADNEYKEELESIQRQTRESGEKPDARYTETLQDRMLKNGQIFDMDLKDVAWGFFKWEDLGYEEGIYPSSL